jgi:hypothetical protein
MSGTRSHEAVKSRPVPVVSVVTLLIPVAVWLILTHSPVDYFTHHLPPGQRLYILSKLCALLAIASLLPRGDSRRREQCHRISGAWVMH